MSGQQVSTVLSSIGSVDSSPRTGLAQAETSTSDAFGASFEQALTKEHSPNSNQQSRQLPAGVGNLSEISLAMAKNAPETGPNTADETNEDLLANNLLQQIAFTKKSNEAELTAETRDIKLTDTKTPITTGPVLITDEPEADPKLVLPDDAVKLPNKATKSPVMEGSPVRITDETKPELTLPDSPDGKPGKTVRSPIMEGGPVRITDETKPELTLLDSPDGKQGKTVRAPIMEGGPVRNEDKTKPELTLPDSPDGKQGKTVRAPIIEGGPVRNEDKTKPELTLPDSPDGKQDKMVRAPIMEGGPVRNDDKTKPELELPNQPGKGHIRPGTDPVHRNGPIAIDIGGRPDPEIGVPVKPIYIQANINLAAAANKDQTKADEKTPGKSKVSLADKVDTDKMASSAKQTEATAQLAEKLTPANSSRQETNFAATIASSVTSAQASAAESRLAAATNNANQTATHAEQLKQSINLMKQDAAGHMRQQVSMMLSQQIQKAEIRLDPAGLGMMQIKIDMQQEQATVQFTVQQQQAKELIEQQLPRLREMLQQQGIQLSEGQVQQQSQQQQQQQRQLAQQGQQNQSFAQGEDASAEQLGMPIQLVVKQSERIVDYYA